MSGDRDILQSNFPPEHFMDRRTSLIAALAIATGAATAKEKAITQASGAIKVTVLYGHPKSPDEFEKYYLGTHMPLVMAAKRGKRTETSKCPPAADGSPAPYYRIFEVWFDSMEDMAAVTGTPEWKNVVADVPNFATGGITRVMSKLD
jgi:uncharacterized protein (TIGR02118 family)